MRFSHNNHLLGATALFAAAAADDCGEGPFGEKQWFGAPHDRKRANTSAIPRGRVVPSSLESRLGRASGTSKASSSVTPTAPKARYMATQKETGHPTPITWAGVNKRRSLVFRSEVIGMTAREPTESARYHSPSAAGRLSK